MEEGVGDDSHRPEVRHDDLIVGEPAPKAFLNVADQVKNVDRIDEPALEEGRVCVDAHPFLLEQAAPDEVEKPLAVWIRHGVPTSSSGKRQRPGRSTRGYWARRWRR